MSRAKSEPLEIEDAKELTKFMSELVVQQFRLGDLHVIFKCTNKGTEASKTPDKED